MSVVPEHVPPAPGESAPPLSPAGGPVYLERWLPPTGPAPATLALTLCFMAAVAGVLAASRLPGWLPYGLLAVGLAGLWVGNRAGARGIRSAWPLAVAVAVFALMATVEQARQERNHAVVEQVLAGAQPPFDSVGVADSPALQLAVDRTAPRLRLVQVVAVVETAPPPPMERHRLEGRTRRYRLRTESIAGPGAAPEAIAAELQVAVRDDPRLSADDLAGRGAPPAAALTGAPAFHDSAAPEVLYPLPGERVEFTAVLAELDPGEVAPGQYDAPLAWLLDGVHARTTLDPRQWRRLPAAGAAGPLVAAARAQIALSNALNRHLGGRAADTLRALCWGDTSDLTVEDRASFQHTGTVHLLAISGLHVYILLYLLFRLTRPILALGGGRRRLWRFAAVAVALWVFAAMTGFQEPVLRAVGMFTLWVGARAAGRRFDALNALSFCGLVVMFVSPQSAHRIGFQLSYLSVGLLCWWGPALSDWLRRRVFGRLDRFLLPQLLDGLSQAMAAGVIALFATLPLTVYAFGVAPMWAIVANLILIPLVELLLMLALPLGLALIWTDPGWHSQALQYCTDRVLAAADGLSGWIGSAADAPPPPGWALPLSWLALVWAGAYFKRATQPVLAADGLAVRRRFSYPATGAALGLVGCGALALCGRVLPPGPGADPAGYLPARAGGWQAVTPLRPVVILGRLQPPVVARAQEPSWREVDGAFGTGQVPVEAWTLEPPDNPQEVETILRRPVAAWRGLLSPAARERVTALSPAVWLFADGAETRAAVMAQLPPAGGLKPVLLVAPTAASAQEAASVPAALAGRVRAVIVLSSPWRLLEADGQAWLAFGRAHGVPVLGADATAVWRLDPDGRGAWITVAGEPHWLSFEAK